MLQRVCIFKKLLVCHLDFKTRETHLSDLIIDLALSISLIENNNVTGLLIL